MMLALLLAAAVAAPTPCPSDPLVANPRLKVVRARDKTLDNYVITVDVTNRGTQTQPQGLRQRLDLIEKGRVIGTQPIPALAGNETYPAAFRLQLPHQRRHPPFVVSFRYVLAGAVPSRADCDTANDTLTATLR